MKKSTFFIMILIIAALVWLTAQSTTTPFDSVTKQLNKLYAKADAIDDIVFELEQLNSEITQANDIVYELEKMKKHTSPEVDALIDDIDFCLFGIEDLPRRISNNLYDIKEDITTETDYIAEDLSKIEKTNVIMEKPYDSLAAVLVFFGGICMLMLPIFLIRFLIYGIRFFLTKDRTKKEMITKQVDDTIIAVCASYLFGIVEKDKSPEVDNAFDSPLLGIRPREKFENENTLQRALSAFISFSFWYTIILCINGL